MTKRKITLSSAIEATFCCAVYLLSVSSLRAVTDFRGTVTVDSTHPVLNAIVKLQTPEGTFITDTDTNGDFVLHDVKGSRMVLSVSLEGKLLYRDIRNFDESRLDVNLAGSKAGKIPPNFRPNGLMILGNGDLLTFESDKGRLLRIHADEAQFLGRVSDRILAVSLGRYRGEETVLVAVGSLPEAGHVSPIGQIEELSAVNGKLIRRWQRVNLKCCSALAFDEKTDLVYLAPFGDPTVYKLDLDTRKFQAVKQIGYPETVPITNLPITASMLNKESITSLILVKQNRTIYCLISDGSVQALDLDNLKATPLAMRGNSAASDAIAVDPIRKLLYTGKSNRVSKVSLAGPSPYTSEPFIQRGPLKEISQMVVDERGNIWVVDSRSTIMCFSPTGTLLQSIRASP
jgi:hypothetical protein